ncbi:uncharacterized protein LOC121405003 [Drosophila obscura]|uniref:uncharacterized protein LOC121405003 n=1 Tax=Drosophila obscura TaxID=7282 RepID=UPI001BB10F7B|nr:uncharacterized protein LOC121405003 [Drosophila obscura]
MAESVYLSRKMLNKPKAFCYEFILDKDGLFAPCENYPGNPAGIDALFDMSKFEITLKAESTVQMAGDAVIVWQDVKPSDTVTMFAQVYHYEQGTWQKTMFSASSNNFCKNMFEKNQYWYKFWTQHIINSDEVKKTCLNTRGSLLKHESFDQELKVNVNVPNMNGRYKLVLLFEAFDNRNVKRPVSVCTELRGMIQKV